MSKRIQIKPDQTAVMLPQILGERFARMEIGFVSIDVETRVVTIEVCSNDAPDEGVLAQASSAVADHLGIDCLNVRMLWRPSEQVSLSALVSANKEAIVGAISEQLPALKAFRNEIELVCKGEQTVEVVIPGELNVARASRRQFRETLTKTLSECCGRRIVPRVSLSTVEIDSVVDEPVSQEEIALAAQNPVLLGRKIVGTVDPIATIVGEAKGVVLEGRIFTTDYRSIKNGSVLNLFSITDNSDSIAVKAICKHRLALAEEMWVRVRGDVVFDKYAEEPVLMARDIMTAASPPQRTDLSEEKRVELHLHTKMSSMDSVLEISDALYALKEWGHKAVAITDHGVVQAFPLAQALAEKLGIKIIYGVEGYMVESDARSEVPYHVVLLARDPEGLKQIYKLVSKSNLDHFYRRPRMLRSEIEQNRSRLFVGSACEAGEIYRALVNGADDSTITQMAGFYDYLEIQPVANNLFLTENGRFSEKDLIDFNKRIYTVGKALGKPVVAAGDVHFLHPEDAIYRRVLITAQGFENAEKDTPLWLRTTEEMLREFEYLGEEAAREVVVCAPNAIASQIEKCKPVPDGFYAPHMAGAESELESFVRAEAARLYGDPLPAPVKERMERELDAIISGGFAGIYSICRRLVKKSVSDGFLVGSRGSVGSSFAARLFGITEVNPLDPHHRCPRCLKTEFDLSDMYDSGFDLPERSCPRCGEPMERDGQKIAFEVFMGFEGDKVPDIDLNFSGQNQGAVIKYTEELMGRGNVFRAGTIMTIAERTAFGLVKAYVEASGSRPRKAEMARLARGITGVKRTTSQHPGGVLLIPEGMDILDFTPIQYPADDRKSGTVTTHFDYNSISGSLPKMDILGHDDPTALRMLYEYTGVDPATIAFNDPETMSIFSSTSVLGYEPSEMGCAVGTIGIPEFGTRFVRQMLSEAKPSDFSGLVRISGLSHGTDVWLNNAQDIIRSGIAPLAEVICARDDIFHQLSEKGISKAHAFRIMENVRKGRGISDDDVAAMKSAGVADWYLDSCHRIKYLFPKAHAAAYVMMAFRIAYFKVHHPPAFYAQYLSLRTDHIDLPTIWGGSKAVRAKLDEFESRGTDLTQKERDQSTVFEAVLEMFLRGISVAPVSLYESDTEQFLIKDEKLVPPFAALPGMGKAAVRNLQKARSDGPFLSIEDLRVRAKLQKNLIELMRQSGCLEDLPERNQIELL